MNVTSPALRVVGGLLLAGWAAARGDVLAHWRFDGPVGVAPAMAASDAGSRPWRALLASGRIEAGKVGHALVFDPARSEPARMETARSLEMDTALPLGAEDWTIECWLCLDPAAKAEGTIFELGVAGQESRGPGVRWDVRPEENAFVFTGLVATTEASGDVLAPRIEFPRADGPPGGVGYRREWTLRAPHALARGAWLHVAIVHAYGKLRLFVAGQPVAEVTAALATLPALQSWRIAMGQDGQGGRRLAGAIDEVRIADRAEYAAGSTPGS